MSDIQLQISGKQIDTIPINTGDAITSWIATFLRLVICVAPTVYSASGSSKTDPPWLMSCWMGLSNVSPAPVTKLILSRRQEG